MDFLALGLVAHVGFNVEGQIYVIPMSYQYDLEEPSRIYLHGGHSSRLLGHLAAGVPVCVEVTLVDGLVYSRAALYHSVNYRSVVVFGTARELTDTARKAKVLERMIERYFPGRTAGVDYAASTSVELNATAMVEVVIEEMSAKKREGPPKGPTDLLPEALGSCGVADRVDGVRSQWNAPWVTNRL